MGKVFVVEDSGHNYADALRYGEIVILNQDDYPLNFNGRNGGLIDRIESQFVRFDPKEDRLLLLGDPILIGLCFHLLSKYSRVIPILKWDRKRREYQPTTIIL